ncbi:MAG: SMP-30/gluconolactonase/LRE family protein [Acidobacteria bacterium]|nr:SMP-30/gluconolactonase/LRE family protein [Acidobacteriota bacterium]
MGQAGKIISIEPKYAIPGAEIAVNCNGFRAEHGSDHAVFVDDTDCQITAASSSRILAVVPPEVDGGSTRVHLSSGGSSSNYHPYVVGKRLVDGMHIVANPAIDPNDDAIILTRSGSRGQHLEGTLFRLEPDGYLDELPEAILNPTGIAFDNERQMFVTNRAQGEVYAISRNGSSSVYATGLGIATGLAFDADGIMYVGDRSGTIYRVRDFAEVEAFATMEPSVAAYHIAFGPDGRLYVTAPGLSSHDAIYSIDQSGQVSTFARGFGRPQGIAFDTEGNLYVAACYQGRHGIVKISPDGQSIENFVAGNNVIGLCFTRSGDMIVATNDSVYSIPCDVQGTLI